ncbi:MAG: hypothetical protein NTZ70_01815 [Methylococcales bacterium]|nr:hypothetical protein [Methylococcales bacterium]
MWFILHVNAKIIDEIFMLFHFLKLGSTLLLLQSAKKKLMFLKSRIFSGMIARLIRLTHVAIYFCVAYIVLFGLYFLWVDFDLRNSLPNQLDYENRAWLHIQVVKNNVDGYIKIIFDGLFAMVKFVISELLVVPILLCLLVFLISLAKHKDPSNQSAKKSDNAGILKPKRPIDIAKRNLRSVFKTIDPKIIKAQQNKMRVKQEEKLIDEKIKHAQQKINIIRENSFVGSAIDNLTGNSIDSEIDKITELEKQKESIKPFQKKPRRRIDIARKNLKNLVKNGIFR